MSIWISTKTFNEKCNALFVWKDLWCLSQREYAVCIFMDLTKAFDFVEIFCSGNCNTTEWMVRHIVGLKVIFGIDWDKFSIVSYIPLLQHVTDRTYSHHINDLQLLNIRYLFLVESPHGVKCRTPQSRLNILLAQ